MGWYIENDEKKSKERWLEENGDFQPIWPEWGDLPSGQHPVMLVDNGLFRAAGVCYNEREYKEFTNPNDYRPRTLFLVNDTLLVEKVPYLAMFIVETGIEDEWVLSEEIVGAARKQLEETE